jgi:cyanophycinase-like exopeptidase
MAEIVAGRVLDRVRLRLVRSSRQSFALAWKKDGADMSLAGVTVTIELGTVIWTAANAGNISTWTLSEVQTALASRYHEGVIVLTTTAGREVAYAVTVEVQ